MFEILIICLFNLLIYLPTIKYGLVMDDMQWYEQKNKNGLIPLNRVRNLHYLLAVMMERLYGGTTFGTNPRIEHAFTLFLHALICCLIYLAFGHNTISLGAAVLYSCHPLNNQTSIWLNGRRYAVSIILVLLIILLFPLGTWGRVLAFFLYLSTGLLHMTAIFTPVLFGIDNLLIITTLALIFSKDISLKIHTRLEKLPDCEQKHFSPRRAIIVIKSYGFYFFKMLIPGPCAMMYPDLFYWGKTKEGNEDAYRIDLIFYRGIIAFICSGVLWYLLPSSYRPMAVFMVIAVLQWCNIVPVLQVLADRYANMSNVFMMFFVSYGLTAVFHQWAIIPIFIICFYYLLCLNVVMEMYKDIICFYNYHIKFYPAMPWPRVIFIASLMENGHIKEAEALTKGGLLANPKDFSLLMYGAIMCLFKGDYNNGMVFLEEAEKNLYIGVEEDQIKEIMHLKEQLKVIKPRG